MKRWFIISLFYEDKVISTDPEIGAAQANSKWEVMKSRLDSDPQYQVYDRCTLDKVVFYPKTLGTDCERMEEYVPTRKPIREYNVRVAPAGEAAVKSKAQALYESYGGKGILGAPTYVEEFPEEDLFEEEE